MQLKTSIAITQYWNEIRGDKAMPTRADLKPSQVSGLLPDLFILEPLQGDVRFRLAGTRVCTLLGKELRGLSFSSLWTPGQQKSLLALIRGVADNKLPLCLEITGFRRDYAPLRFEMVLLPVSGDAGGMDRVLGSLAPQYSSAWQLLEPVEVMRLDRMNPATGFEYRPQAQDPTPRATPAIAGGLLRYVPFTRKVYNKTAG